MSKTQAVQDMTEAAEAAKAAEQNLQFAVGTAYNAGTSWAEIGAMLGISKQTAFNRFKSSAAILKGWKDQEKAAEAAAAEPKKARKTPSKKVDAEVPAPAPVKVEFLRADSTAQVFREAYMIPGAKETDLAQPGTGKGPHQCPNCGDTNHKGAKSYVARFNLDCVPTKYDTAAITELMKDTHK